MDSPLRIGGFFSTVFSHKCQLFSLLVWQMMEKSLFSGTSRPVDFCCFRCIWHSTGSCMGPCGDQIVLMLHLFSLGKDWVLCFVWWCLGVLCGCDFWQLCLTLDSSKCHSLRQQHVLSGLCKYIRLYFSHMHKNILALPSYLLHKKILKVHLCSHKCQDLIWGKKLGHIKLWSIFTPWSLLLVFSR